MTNTTNNLNNLIGLKSTRNNITLEIIDIVWFGNGEPCSVVFAEHVFGKKQNDRTAVLRSAANNPSDYYFRFDSITFHLSDFK